MDIAGLLPNAVMVLAFAATGDAVVGGAVEQNEVSRSPMMPLKYATGELPCGPASMAIAMTLLDVVLVERELDTLANEDGVSSFAALAAYANQKGLHCVAARLTPAQLTRLDSVAILQIEMPIDRGASREDHFIVMDGRVQTDGYFVFDPIAGTPLRGVVPLDNITKVWTGHVLIVSRDPVNLAALSPSSSTIWYYLGPPLPWVAICAGFVMLLIVLIRQRTKKAAAPINLTGIVIAVACFGNVACSRDADMQSDAAQEPDGSHETGSRFLLGPTVVNLGEISNGVKRQATFRIVNPTDDALDVRLGHVSCGCLSAKLVGASRLAPGEVTDLVVDVNEPGGGRLDQGVLLHLSSLAAPLHLRVTGIVRDDTVVRPKLMDFGEVAADSTPFDRVIRVTHYGSLDSVFRISSVTAADGDLSVVETRDPQRTVLDGAISRWSSELTVRVDPGSKAVGAFADELILTANVGQDEITLRVPYRGDIVPALAVRPSRIFRTLQSSANAAHVELSLKHSTGGRVKVSSVTCDGLALDGWREMPSPTSGKTRIQLSIVPEFSESGRAEGSVTIETTSPHETRVVVPVLFIRSPS